MEPDLLKPGAGGKMDLPLEGTGFAIRIRGVCGPDDREVDGVTFLRQVHGSNVLLSPSGGEEGDAMVFPRGEGCPGLRIADCLPLFAVSDKAVGAAHCGWRGISGGIVTSFLDSMPGVPLYFLLGPRICRSCYDVGKDVRKSVTESDPGGEDDHPDGKLDLGLAVGRQLERWIDRKYPGRGNVIITDIGICTCCSVGHYHSWRREKSRLRNLIWLAPEASIADGWD
jgi:copper oxidase (laccase) domain-containing protein